MALFNKSMRKVAKVLKGIQVAAIEREMGSALPHDPKTRTAGMDPLAESLSGELTAGASSGLTAETPEIVDTELQK